MRKFIGLSAALFTLSASFGLAAPAMEADSSAGKILVNADGMALYTYDKDTAARPIATTNAPRTGRL